MYSTTNVYSSPYYSYVTIPADFATISSSSTTASWSGSATYTIDAPVFNVPECITYVDSAALNINYDNDDEQECNIGEDEFCDIFEVGA